MTIQIIEAVLASTGEVFSLFLTDPEAFYEAEADADVFAYDEAGNAHVLRKGDLTLVS